MTPPRYQHYWVDKPSVFINNNQGKHKLPKLNDLFKANQATLSSRLICERIDRMNIKQLY